MWKKISIEIICFLAAVLFYYTGITKLLHHSLFISQIGKSPLLVDFADWLSWVVPITELIIAVLLYVPCLRRWGLLATFGLMSSFTIYVGVILSRYDDLPCSCGGVIDLMSWQGHLVFNIVFTALAGVAIAFHHSVFPTLPSVPSKKIIA
jgi:uncharacterized membrane protein YphA (DoxX/SURF4 family)